MTSLTLTYDRGTILLHGDVRTPYGSWDPRVRAYRAMALYYNDIVEYLGRSGIDFDDRVLDLLPCPELSSKVELRDYQREALEAWIGAGGRGVIVLPTGAGKTLIALKAIEHINSASLVVVPTLDLLEQWRKRLGEEFSLEIGVYGGGRNDLRPITVATYDSAYLRAEELGNRFALIVFDEVHHLPAPGYSQIAELFASPYRMGLTATYEREDEGHLSLPRLVGGKVYELGVDKLVGEHLADYSLHKIYINLTPEEQEEYERLYNTFTNFLKKRRITLKGPRDFRRFIMMTGRDPEAREALLARNRALSIALNSASKLEALRRILSENPGDRILIFTQHNRLVHTISKEFLIPSITHRTSKEERKEILERFREGSYRRVVTSKVLDEGIDVPDATIAVILSGTGSSREFIQRLGRVLRKKRGKRARLIEIVSGETVETRMSWRRKRKGVKGG